MKTYSQSTHSLMANSRHKESNFLELNKSISIVSIDTGNAGQPEKAQLSGEERRKQGQPSCSWIPEKFL